MKVFLDRDYYVTRQGHNIYAIGSQLPRYWGLTDETMGTNFTSSPIEKKEKRKSNLKMMLFLFILWSWRGLNPRPNKEAIRFLHAYSSLRFSCSNKTWTTNCCLIL